MSVERIFYCDGPDCEAHIRTMKEYPPMFLTVTEHEDRDHVSQFCGWDCVLRHAATHEPVETIRVDDEGEVA